MGNTGGPRMNGDVVQSGPRDVSTRGEGSRWSEWLVLAGAVAMFLFLVGGLVLYRVIMESEYQRIRAAEVQVAYNQMRILERLVEQYRDNNGKLPASLRTLLQDDPLFDGKPYLGDASVLIDPWGKPYGYDNPIGRMARVYCHTPDGKFLTPGR
jgi:hypothetical protein